MKLTLGDVYKSLSAYASKMGKQQCAEARDAAALAGFAVLMRDWSAVEIVRCKSCGMLVVWTMSMKPGGKPMIRDLSGTPHWATCPHADQHRREKEARDASE